MSLLNEPIVTTIIGAIIGFVASVLGGWIVYTQEKRNQESFSSSILYNDLKSIERYLAHERSSVNLRYSDDWQHIVAACSFLNDKDIEWIYEIYDEVYNYNYHYKSKEQEGMVFSKEHIGSYKELQNRMFDISRGYPNFERYSKEYEAVINSLQKHKKCLAAYVP